MFSLKKNHKIKDTLFFSFYYQNPLSSISERMASHELVVPLIALIKHHSLVDKRNWCVTNILFPLSLSVSYFAHIHVRSFQSSPIPFAEFLSGNPTFAIFTEKIFYQLQQNCHKVYSSTALAPTQKAIVQGFQKFEFKSSQMQ